MVQSCLPTCIHNTKMVAPFGLGRNKEHLLQIKSQDTTWPRPCCLLRLVGEMWHVQLQVGQVWDMPLWPSSFLPQELGPYPPQVLSSLALTNLLPSF